MVSLEAGEDECVVLQRGGELRGCLGLNSGVDGAVEGVVGFLDKRCDLGVGQHLGRETALGKDLAHGAVEDLTVEGDAPDIASRQGKQIRPV